MKTYIIAVIGISMVLAFVPFLTAQDAPIDAKAAEEARQQAGVTAKAKAKQADEAKRIAEAKAKAASDARAALAKQQKNMARQTAELEAAADKNAAQKAKDEMQANQAAAKTKRDAELKAENAAKLKAADEVRAKQAEEAKAARDAKVKARIGAGSEAQAGVPGVVVLSKGEAEKKVAVTSKDLEKNKWRVAVGMLTRQIGGRSMRTAGSYSQSYAVGQKSTDDHWVGPAGGMNDAGNRTYDNGYVGSDGYTELDGGTWNWGYDSGQQINGNQVEFTGVGRVWREYTRQVTGSDAYNTDNNEYKGGLMVEVERYMLQTRFVDYGLSLGLSRAQTYEMNIAGLNTYNDYQQWNTYNDLVLDSYDITGLGITPLTAPYRGNQKDEGPTISTTPMTRQGLGSELVSVESYRAYNSIAESFDMDLSTLSLGVSLKGNYRRVYLMGSTGPTLNMVEKDATYEETLYGSSNGGSPQVLMNWGDSSSGTECLFGYYVQAELGVRIYRELHLGVFGRYDWLENVSGNVGPSRYEVNPSGGSMGGTVGLNF